MSQLLLKYDPSLVGAKMAAKNDSVQFQTQPWQGYGSVYYANTNDYIICTGYYYVADEYAYIQGENGWYAVVDFYKVQDDYWKITNNYASVPTYSDNQADRLIKKIIDNNITILRNNLLCARYANRFSSAQQSQIRELQKRLQARNNALQAGGLCDQIQTGYPAEYAELSAYLDALMSGETIGVATWVAVVIFAVVISGLGTAAYFTYKSLADESEKDVKFSKELTATLVNKLTEEEYQQLLQETKGLLTKSKIKGLIRGGSGVAKVALLIVGGWSIYQIIKQARS